MPVVSERRWRLPLTLGVLVVVTAMGLSATWLSWRGERSSAHSRDRRAADLASVALSNLLQLTIGALRGADGLAVNGVVNDEAFAAFASDVLKDSLFPALAYSMVVPDAQLAAFEQQRGLAVRDSSSTGLVPAASRPVHLVVVDVVPVNDTTRPLLGFDLASDPIRAEVAAQASNSGTAAISRKITLANSDRPGIFIAEAVQDAGGHVVGYLSSGVNLDQVLTVATKDQPRLAGRVRLALDGVQVAGPSAQHGATTSFNAGGRTWTVTADDPDNTHLLIPSLMALGTLAIVLVLSDAYRRDRRFERIQSRAADQGILVQSVIDATTDSVFAKDREGRHLLANRARAAAIAKGNADVDVIGKSVDDFVDADLATQIRRDEATVMRDRTEVRVEEILELPDGPHIFDVNKAPLYDATGNVIGVVGVARDVTEERQLRADRERLYRVEHELATKLQLSMLGNDRLDDERFDVAALYQPAGGMTVGGDWFDALQLANGIALVVGDAVGHGIDSATAMGQLRSALSALAGVGRDPAVTLEALDAFARTNAHAGTATCAYVTIDANDQVLTYSSAGHLPPLVLSADGDAQFLPVGQDPPLAIPTASGPRHQTALAFPPGSSVLLYTDGLVERRGEVIDIGLERLRVAAQAHSHQSMKALCSGVIADLIGASPLRDDVAVVAARLLSPATGPR